MVHRTLLGFHVMSRRPRHARRRTCASLAAGSWRHVGACIRIHSCCMCVMRSVPQSPRSPILIVGSRRCILHARDFAPGLTEIAPAPDHSMLRCDDRRRGGCMNTYAGLRRPENNLTMIRPTRSLRHPKKKRGYSTRACHAATRPNTCFQNFPEGKNEKI